MFYLILCCFFLFWQQLLVSFWAKTSQRDSRSLQIIGRTMYFRLLLTSYDDKTLLLSMLVSKTCVHILSMKIASLQRYWTIWLENRTFILLEYSPSCLQWMWICFCWAQMGYLNCSTCQHQINSLQFLTNKLMSPTNQLVMVTVQVKINEFEKL